MGTFPIAVGYGYTSSLTLVLVGAILLALMLAIAWRRVLDIEETLMLMLDVYSAGLSVGGIGGFLLFYILNPKPSTIKILGLLGFLAVWSFWNMSQALREGESPHESE